MLVAAHYAIQDANRRLGERHRKALEAADQCKAIGGFPILDDRGLRLERCER